MVNEAEILTVAAVVALVAMAYSLHKAGQGVSAVGQAINPLNPNNAPASAVNAVVSQVTGRDETLGGWIYDLTHSDPMAPAPVVNTGGATGSW